LFSGQISLTDEKNKDENEREQMRKTQMKESRWLVLVVQRIVTLWLMQQDGDYFWRPMGVFDNF
jgi:hypothetical protein